MPGELRVRTCGAEFSEQGRTGDAVPRYQFVADATLTGRRIEGDVLASESAPASAEGVLAAALAANQRMTRLVTELREKNAGLRAQNTQLAGAGVLVGRCRGFATDVVRALVLATVASDG